MKKNNKILLSIIGIAVLIVAVVGVTYAFFNYTRTGSQNIIKTGRIYFNSEQGTAINLTNLFPVDPTETGVMDDATKVGTVTINVIGDTTYSGGIEYLVSAVNVQNSVGSKQLPISIQVSVEDNNENDPSTSLGTSDTNYFTNRGTSAQTSIYKVLASDVIKNNDQLVVGYIKSGQDGIDGNIVIKAYIDKEKVAISDTYTEGDRYEVISGLSSETLSECVTHLESINYNNYLLTGETLNDFCAGTGTIDGKTFQETLNRGAFDSTSLTYFVNHNIIRYLGQDGTTDEWVNEREVFTTTEWNSLQTNGVSFQVKVEANEGVWVDEPATPDEYFDTVLKLTGTYNTNRTSEDIANCVTYFTNQGANGMLLDGETLEAFCDGTGTLNGDTMQQLLDSGEFPSAIVSYFESINIVSNVQKYVVIRDYDPDGGSDVIIPKKINIKSYQYNTNRTSEDIANCVTYFTNQRWNERLLEGETLESFCDGTGTLEGDTMQQLLDSGEFPSAFASYLESINILTVSGQSKYTVKEIASGAFYRNQLTSVTIPNSVTTIGRINTFYGNPDLTSLTIDMNDIPENFASNSGITSLNELILGNNVTTIGNAAFFDNQLTSVTIPNSVTTIGNDAFSNNQLTSVTIPNSVTTIGINAFFDNQLTSVTIPNSVTTIGNAAFFDNQLTSVIVPNSVINSPWYGENKCHYFDGGVNVTWNDTTILCEEKPPSE